MAQTYRKMEVIVVDDGSPNSTGDVVARYPEVRRVQQQNRGVAEARNAGFVPAAANTFFLTRMTGDAERGGDASTLFRRAS